MTKTYAEMMAEARAEARALADCENADAIRAWYAQYRPGWIETNHLDLPGSNIWAAAFGRLAGMVQGLIPAESDNDEAAELAADARADAGPWINGQWQPLTGTPMACTGCGKPAEQIPGTDPARWRHVSVEDAMDCAPSDHGLTVRVA